MRGPRDEGTPCGVRRSALTRSSTSLLPGLPRKGVRSFFRGDLRQMQKVM